jgi:hypothetical protein
MSGERAIGVERTGDASADRWDFYRDEDNRWRWKYIMQGRTVAQAYEAHARYADCVADAKQHGYRESGGHGARSRKTR